MVHESSAVSIGHRVYTATDMPLDKPNKLSSIVDAAAAGGYAVTATCCYNLEGIIATVGAAEAQRSPAIIQLFPWAIEFAGGLLVHAAAEAARNAAVPIGVHMDHAQSPDLIRRAADLGGFDGIMIDMSHYDKDENMAKTKELASYCHGRGIITEAEPGRIEGGEDGVADTADLEAVLTTPEQAEEFLALGIDWLAPAFGNVHGRYGPRGPRLDYDRLRGDPGRHQGQGAAGAAWRERLRSGAVQEVHRVRRGKVQHQRCPESGVQEGDEGEG